MILDRADTWPADLIVIGTHGRSGLSRVVLGSISLRVIREARCSVRVGRASERKPEEPLRIVIGNDGSAQAAAAIDAVSRRIWPAGAEVRIIGVPQTLAPVDAASFALASHSLLAAETFLETDREERHRFGLVIDRSAKKLEDAGLTVSTLVEDGSPAQVIMRESRDWRADAIFVGANGIGRIERLLLGSVAESLVTHAPCTVEVVRSR
jgi:nucleotide-binding universal stress UspA family protein